MISDSEKEDFHSSITRCGFQIDDFQLTEYRNPPASEGIYVITGTVKIRRNGVERIYTAGNASSWPAQFARDLQNEFFGIPPL